MQKKAPQFRPTKMESRADRTDRAARDIIQEEEKVRREKIARLREARLKRDKA